ncbi:MAG: hypothetical protein JWR51_1997 [Devosia sp.]|nr:hypothetical protein [Devosia sp.]
MRVYARVWDLAREVLFELFKQAETAHSATSSWFEGRLRLPPHHEVY